MERKTAEAVYAACERALANLTEAEVAIARISDAEERAALLRRLANAVTEILGGLRAPAVVQFPDIQPSESPGEPDTTLDQEELEAVAGLDDDDVARIDAALLAECASTWRKVARVVGAALLGLPESDRLPLGYLALRVIALVEAGSLVSQGNLHFMRFSEVRLPRTVVRAS